MIAGLAAGMSPFGTALADPNCNTGLSRVAQKAAIRAVEANMHTACEALHGGTGLDKTKTLKLAKFELCEDGAVVTAKVAVEIECATSDSAVIRTSQGDTLHAEARADLDTCVVSETRVHASGFLADLGLKWSEASEKLKMAAEKGIADLCNGGR